MSILGALDWKTFLKHLFRSFWKTKGTQMRLTSRRALVLAVFLFLFTVLGLFTRLGFLLDLLFFPGFRKQKVTAPVFIIGNFRSGSTFMFRLLARDRENFRAFQSWEIYTAPSISQKKFIRGLRMLDDVFGKPLQNLLYSWERRSLKPVSIHKIGIHKYEEDVALLLHIWAGFFTWFFFPWLDGKPPWHKFDTHMPPGPKARIMKFYESCVKRQLYCRGRETTFLSKNPSFSPMVASLADTFPGARFIYLARNPVHMVPSQTSWFSFAWHYFSSPLEQFPNRDFTLDLMGSWYRYPVEFLKKNLPPERYIILRYEDFMTDVGGTLRAVYKRFGIPLTGRFAEILKEEEKMHSNYVSRHEYSLEDQGYDRRAVIKALEDVFESFGFDTEADTGYSNGEY